MPRRGSECEGAPSRPPRTPCSLSIEGRSRCPCRIGATAIRGSIPCLRLGARGGGQDAFRRHGPARSQHGASACFGAASPLRTRRAAAHQPSKGPASERRLSGVPMPRRGSEYLAHSRRPAPGTFRRHGYGLAGCDHRASACFGAAPPLRTRRAAAHQPSKGPASKRRLSGVPMPRWESSTNAAVKSNPG